MAKQSVIVVVWVLLSTLLAVQVSAQDGPTSQPPMVEVTAGADRIRKTRLPIRVSNWHWRRGVTSLWSIIRQGIRSIIRLVPTPKVLIGEGILFLINCAVVFTLTVGQQVVSPTYPDPFATYDDIVLGQHVMALNAYPCGPYLDSIYTARNVPLMSCQIRHDSGPIELITVVCSYGVIQHITFDVEGLEFADVIQRWGPPDVLETTKQLYIARWDEGVLVRGGLSKAFSYHAPVQEVILS